MLCIHILVITPLLPFILILTFTTTTIDTCNLYFRHNHVDYDLAVVILSSPFKFSESIQAIGLPPSNSDPPVGQRAVATGWGLTEAGNSNSSSCRLRRAIVEVMSQDYCKRCYGIYSITDRMMCAGSKDGKRDACMVSVTNITTIFVYKGFGLNRAAYINCN